MSTISSLLCDEAESSECQAVMEQNSPVQEFSVPEAYGLQNVINIFFILKSSKELVLAPCKRYLKKTSYGPAYLKSFELNRFGSLVFTVVFKNGSRIIKKVLPTEIMLQNSITKYDIPRHNRQGKVVEVSFSQFCIAADLQVRFGYDFKKATLEKSEVAARIFRNNLFYEQ